MHGGMTQRIIARQQNQTQSAGDREENRPNSTRLVEFTLVRHQLTGVPQPSLRQKREIEEDDGNHATGDKQRFQALRANIGNISVSPGVSIRPLVQMSDVQGDMINHGLTTTYAMVCPRSILG